MNIGRTLVFSFWTLPLVFRGRKKKSSLNKRKICSIMGKIYLYEVCAYFILFLTSLFYYDYNKTHLTFPDYWHLPHQGQGVQEVLDFRI